MPWQCHTYHGSTIHTYFISLSQLSTLPHYVDPLVRLGKTENQVKRSCHGQVMLVRNISIPQESFKDPYQAPNFYFEEPNRVKRPVSMHLQPTFVN